MKKTLFIIVYFIGLSSYAQTELDDIKAKYHPIFEDNFLAYADPAGPWPASDFSTNPSSPYYSFFHDNWTTDKGDYGGINLFKPQNVTMPSPGIIKLTENAFGSLYLTTKSDGSARYVNHHSGAITTTRAFGFGILEAEMKISNDTHTGTQLASSAFWTNPGGGRHKTEIDVIDASENNYLMYRVIDYSYPGQHVQTLTYGHPTDLSPDFHLYSAVWDPSGVSYYLDGNFTKRIAFTTVRNYDDLYSVSIALNADTFTVGGTSMYVKSVKMWRKNCTGEDVNITFPTSMYDGDIFEYMPFLNPGLTKYKSISLNVSGPTFMTVLGGPITTRADDATIIEAEATTIGPNFLADESVLHTATVLLDGGNKDQISNGYLLITPLDCEHDNSGQYAWYRSSPKIDDSLAQNSSAIIHTDLSDGYLTSVSEGNKRSQMPDQFYVFPNPTQNQITIPYSCKQAGQLDISIKDVAGRIRHEESVLCSEGANINHIVNISDLSSGVYFVELTHNGSHVVKKIVKL